MKLTPDQMRADLILEGWEPKQFERVTGNVWKGVCRGRALCYKPMDCPNDPPLLVPEWLNGRHDLAAEQTACRWSDIPDDILMLIYQEINK